MPEKVHRLASQYWMTHPDFVLFVDECGANTNQKDDGHLGGQLFVIPVEDNDGGLSGATTNLHFTVLLFTAATSNTVLCAIILKSTLNIEDIPLTWKLGVNNQLSV